jgi:bifunctional UDP-N-acetylglucosamine pyrophosphorylase / glucosamine-1-phosphate N-acetyltransferase
MTAVHPATAASTAATNPGALPESADSANNLPVGSCRALSGLMLAHRAATGALFSRVCGSPSEWLADQVASERWLNVSCLAIVLAAGKSTRMKSALPKVLHEVAGRPMIDYVLDAARQAGATRIVAVVGHRADLVQAHLQQYGDVEFALQSEQKGTGHAVMMCRDQLARHAGAVLILAGDTPLLRPASLQALLTEQQQRDAAAVIGTADTAANQGLGRIVRDHAGQFVKIVEEKDATASEKLIQEINTGCYAFSSPQLLSALDEIRPNNAQAEYYLTDCPKVLLQRGRPVSALQCFTVQEALGVNTRVQLAEVTQHIQMEVMQRWMLSGVTIVSPSQTVIAPQVVIGQDTVVEPFCCLLGDVTIGSNCRIGPQVTITGPVQIPDGTVVPPPAWNIMGQ